MKILHIDIETSPNVADVWGLFKQNISLSQLRESSRMICFAAKWHGEAETKFYSEFSMPYRDMVAVAHNLMNEADAIVHYNGDAFDVPNLNKQFILHGFTPPAPSRHIDLYKVVRRKFRFTSNKLAYVSKELGLSGKVEHEGHTLWVRCMAGDADAWKMMETYNIQDVDLLEELYDILLPWIDNHPNRALYDEDGQEYEPSCPNCASPDLRREGYALTRLGKYQRFRCRDCGKWTRSTKRVAGVEIQGTVGS